MNQSLEPQRAQANVFVTFKAIVNHRIFRPAAGAAVVVLCGLLLWQLPIAQFWSDTSYDLLFRFGARSETNKVVLVQMDDAAAHALGTSRESWDRSLHAQLLDKLAAAGSPLVVFDIHFEQERDRATDDRLALALQRHGRVALMAEWTDAANPGTQTEQPLLPLARFLEAATNWGIGKLDSVDAPVRRHWPFPAPVDGRPSLAWTAARLAGATLDDSPREQWIRYYGEGGGVEPIGYDHALEKPAEYFRGRVVFVGSKPRQPDPQVYEVDKFRTPYTERTGRAVGGAELLAVEFLNLVRHDWLRRLPAGIELCILAVSGVLFGVLMGYCRRYVALGLGLVLALAALIAAVCLSYFTNFWFPWLIVVGGQIPCALILALLPVEGRHAAEPHAMKNLGPRGTVVVQPVGEPLPDASEYELLSPPIGEGGFGKVWIARNAIGQWQALKAVYASKFGNNRGPYEAEFNGLQQYKPVSEKHPGLLRIELISRMKEAGYFYYVMELGDAQTPGWEKQPQLYKPKDLEWLRRQAYGRKLRPAECLRIVIPLTEALHFLHLQGLTHRDIKPSNVIFVNGQPKLADIGLVAAIRPVERIQTMVGTIGFMPPPPEKPGTPQADIYALGMLLYVISTGREPDLFPTLTTTLVGRDGFSEFMRLNAVIIKACQPDLKLRYQNTGEMLADLQKAGGANSSKC